MLKLLLQKNAMAAIMLGAALNQAKTRLEAGEPQNSPVMAELGAAVRAGAHNLATITTTAHAFLPAEEFQQFCQGAVTEPAEVARQIHNAYRS